MVLDKRGQYYYLVHEDLVGIYNSDLMLVETINTKPELSLKPGSIPVKVEPVKTPTPTPLPEPVKEPVKV